MTDIDKEQQAKRIFAEAWLRTPDNALAAALTFIDDRFAAFQIAQRWVHDPEVKAIKLELLETYGEEHFLPSKASMIRQVLNRAEKATEEGFVKMMKLGADMRGFIEKPGVTINNTSVTNNRVMLVPVGKLNDDGTVDADDWSQKAISQQDELTSQ